MDTIQLLDGQYDRQPVVLLDADGEPMSLDQQMDYMRDRSGKETRELVFHCLIDWSFADKYQNLFSLVESAIARKSQQ